MKRTTLSSCVFFFVSVVCFETQHNDISEESIMSLKYAKRNNTIQKSIKLIKTVIVKQQQKQQQNASNITCFAEFQTFKHKKLSTQIQVVQMNLINCYNIKLMRHLETLLNLVLLC